MKDCTKRMLADAGEIIGGAIALFLFALLAWLFLTITPDQYSAECEALRAEIEARQ